MLEAFGRLAFYVATAAALIWASTWWATSAYQTFTGRGKIILAPFTIADAKDEGRGTALAKMLQSRLQQIEYELTLSQDALLQQPNVTNIDQTPSTSSWNSVLPRLFTNPVSIQTALFEPADLKIAVAGVDVGGLVPWFQRFLESPKTLDFTYYQSASDIVVSGSLAPLGLEGEALRVTIPLQGAAPDLDKVATLVATEIERRRLAADPTNRVEALHTIEFGNLLDVLNSAAHLNRQAELGRPSREQFNDLLVQLEPLASNVHDWFELELLTAAVARSADKPERAAIHFRTALLTMTDRASQTSGAALSSLQKQIEDVNEAIQALQAAVAEEISTRDKNALAKIRTETLLVTKAYNKIFKVDYTPVPVTLGDPNLPNAYYDGKSYVAPAPVAQLPEVTWHEVSFRYLKDFLQFSGPFEDQSQALLLSYADILAMIVKQLGLVREASTSWDLSPGAVGWIKSAIQKKEFILGEDPRPLMSFSQPGNAYDDPVVGKDRQIAHIKDLKPDTDPYSSAGIGNKAFYETAKRLGVQRAGEIWIEALTCLKPLQQHVTYKALATCLIESTKPTEASQLREALTTVGLGS